MGAYLGSLIGALYALDRGMSTLKRPDQPESERGSGVTLAVNAAPEAEKQVAGILRKAGGVAVERAQGQWNEGKWVDFDPNSAPELEKDF